MASDDRYTFLDGIRGIAAMFVVIRHTPQLWGFHFFRNHLAVDLFFILSGFVIGHAYDAKLRNGRLSAPQFCLVRIIRLYPVYLVSALVCAIVVAAKHAMLQATGDWNHDVVMLLLTALMLPSKAIGSKFFFALNGPAWSLFFEMVVNVFYAVIRPLLIGNRLAMLVATLAVGECYIAFHHGNLDLGFYWVPFAFVPGFVRSAYGIFLGLLLFRRLESIKRRLTPRWLPWATTLCAFLLLASPSYGQLDAVIDLVAVLLVFPVTVASGATVTLRRGHRLCELLGALSYPIYILHLPFKHMLDLLPQAQNDVVAPLSGVLFLAALAIVCLGLERFYDIPVRRWLTQRFIRRRETMKEIVAVSS